jgi:hypothetical protein
MGVAHWAIFALAWPLCFGELARLRRDQPKVDPLLDNLAQHTKDTKIAALSAKAIAAASRAQAAAAQTNTMKIKTQQIEVQNKLKKPYLDDALEMANQASKEAVADAKKAIAALEETRALSKVVIADAKRLAIAEVKSELTAKYNSLAEWRKKVLDNPYERAQQAGLAAAKPYNDMIKKFYARIGQYQLEASNLMKKANGLAGDAAGLAGGAQGRLDGGDKLGANQDMNQAVALKKTSAKYAAAASALHAEANKMNEMIATYVAAGHLAAWHAAYKADPDVLPPPPVNPNIAFTPAPPTLLQKSDKLEEKLDMKSSMKLKTEIEAVEDDSEKLVSDFVWALLSNPQPAIA